MAGGAKQITTQAAIQAASSQPSASSVAGMPTWQKGLMGALTGDKAYGKNAPLIHSIMQHTMPGLMHNAQPHPLTGLPGGLPNPIGAGMPMGAMPQQALGGASNLFGQPGAPGVQHPLNIASVPMTAPHMPTPQGVAMGGGVKPLMQGPHIGADFHGF